MLSFSLLRADKENPESFSIRIPIQFDSSDKLQSGNFSLLDKDFTISGSDNTKIIQISSFESREEAVDFIYEIQGALLHTTVAKKLSLRTVFEITEPKFLDKPANLSENPTLKVLVEADDQPVFTHGHFDTAETVVFKNKYNYLIFGSGRATAVRGYNTDHLKSWISNSLELDSPSSLVKNEKLKLAIELYASTFYKSGKRAKLINYITILESLTEQSKEKKEVLEALEYLKSQLEVKYSGSKELIRNVSNKLGNDKRKSISSNLRKLVKSESDAIGESEESVHKKMNQAYQIRSNLLHEGKTDKDKLDESYSWLAKIVPIILEQHAVRCATSEE